MNVTDMKMLRVSMQAALDSGEYGRKYSIKVGNASYSPEGTGHFKVEFGQVDATTGIVASPEREDFTKMATMYGLTPDDLDAKFTHRGTTYKITGLKTRRPKFPISVVRVSDNKGFKFPDSVVARQKRWKAERTPTTLAGMVSAGE
jgi:hypothetical protein